MFRLLAFLVLLFAHGLPGQIIPTIGNEWTPYSHLIKARVDSIILAARTQFKSLKIGPARQNKKGFSVWDADNGTLLAPGPCEVSSLTDGDMLDCTLSPVGNPGSMEVSYRGLLAEVVRALPDGWKRESGVLKGTPSTGFASPDGKVQGILYVLSEDGGIGKNAQARIHYNVTAFRSPAPMAPNYLSEDRNTLQSLPQFVIVSLDSVVESLADARKKRAEVKEMGIRGGDPDMGQLGLNLAAASDRYAEQKYRDTCQVVSRVLSSARQLQLPEVDDVVQSVNAEFRKRNLKTCW